MTTTMMPSTSTMFSDHTSLSSAVDNITSTEGSSSSTVNFAVSSVGINPTNRSDHQSGATEQTTPPGPSNVYAHSSMISNHPEQAAFKKPSPTMCVSSVTTSASSAFRRPLFRPNVFDPTASSLPEYQEVVPTLRSNPEQMRKCISIDLLIASQREASFLRMIDRKAPVLYEQNVVDNAVRRYECYWLPMQARRPDINNVPPLDVHWVWHCHMLCPQKYKQDCEAICGTIVDHKLLSANEIQQRYEQSVSVWQEYCSDEPYDFLVSISSDRGTMKYERKSSYDIAAACQRQRNFNYQISLPHYTSPRFLSEAVGRYMQFLLLKQTYTDQFFTPCYDFDIVWHTHQVHPCNYIRDCTAIFGFIMKHDDNVNDRSKNSKLLKGEALTKRLWAAHFSDQFWRRGCMYRGHLPPSFLGLESQDVSSMSYGIVHIPSITLKEIPLQRDQLRLKLSYGTKKVTTFNADLSTKQVTKSGFSLVWQPSDNADTSSIVKFPFDMQNPKDLLIELELYDKLFLQRKDRLKLVGKMPISGVSVILNLKHPNCSMDLPREITLELFGRSN
ncbi:hypothetical protein AB6A40_003839 [Gnathostoma spinigerum]|uniref:Uncharacterized protein n=1 Tax=Gnathostoma spinigerum TaxID=75299 RepID=A0ABD6ELH9_9BILA